MCGFESVLPCIVGVWLIIDFSSRWLREINIRFECFPYFTLLARARMLRDVHLMAMQYFSNSHWSWKCEHIVVLPRTHTHTHICLMPLELLPVGVGIVWFSVAVLPFCRQFYRTIFCLHWILPVCMCVHVCVYVWRIYCERRNRCFEPNWRVVMWLWCGECWKMTHDFVLCKNNSKCRCIVDDVVGAGTKQGNMFWYEILILVLLAKPVAKCESVWVCALVESRFSVKTTNSTRVVLVSLLRIISMFFIYYYYCSAEKERERERRETRFFCCLPFMSPTF